LRFLRSAGFLAAMVISISVAVASTVNTAPEDLLRAGKANDARRQLDAAIHQNPNDAEAYNLLCRLYFQLEQWDNALHMAEKSVELAPKNSNYHLWLGRAAGRKAEIANPFAAWGLARRVRSEFERAVELDGNNMPARSDLAEYYMEAPGFLGGDKKRAREQADMVARQDPALATYIYARLAEKQGSAQAEQEYKKAINKSGNMSRYWIELAYYYRRAGRVADMEAAISQAGQGARQGSAPEYDGAYLLLRTNRNLNAAIQMLKRSLSDNTSSEDAPAFRAHYMLGELLEKQGDNKAAAAEFRSALEMASEFRPARDALNRISR
jgi:tetratricopeptide (TPR) repeat protein